MEGNLTSLGAAIATSLSAGEETPSRPGGFNRPWQMSYAQQHPEQQNTDNYTAWSAGSPSELATIHHKRRRITYDSEIESMFGYQFPLTQSYNFFRIQISPPNSSNGQFEIIQQQLKIIQEQQAALSEISQKVATLTKVVQQSKGSIPVLEDERSHHATVVQSDFDCLPIGSPIELCSLEVKLGAREEQSLSLVSY